MAVVVLVLTTVAPTGVSGTPQSESSVNERKKIEEELIGQMLCLGMFVKMTSWCWRIVSQ
jgi:hypothetical protein